MQDFWKGFRRLQRAKILRKALAGLIVCLLAIFLSLDVGWLLGWTMPPSFAGWLLSGVAALSLWHLLQQKVLSPSWLLRQTEDLFPHDELSSALDFVQRPDPTRFMQVHLARTSDRMNRVRLPWFEEIRPLRLVLLVLSFLPMLFTQDGPWTIHPQEAQESARGPSPIAGAEGVLRSEQQAAVAEKRVAGEAPLSSMASEPGEERSTGRSVATRPPPAIRTAGQRQNPKGLQRELTPRTLESREKLSPLRDSPRDPHSGTAILSGSEPAKGVEKESPTDPMNSRSIAGAELQREIVRFVPKPVQQDGNQKQLQSAQSSPAERSWPSQEAMSDKKRVAGQGPVGFQEGSKELGPPTPITASFYDAPIQGIFGKGPMRQKEAEDRAGSDPPHRLDGKLPFPGSVFAQRQVLPPDYHQQVDRYFQHMRSRILQKGEKK